jgi:hypothetical protein
MTTVTPQCGEEESQVSKTRKWCVGRAEWRSVTKPGEEESLVIEPENNDEFCLIKRR